MTSATHSSAPASALRHATGNPGSNLGQEADLLARWQVTKNLGLITGDADFFTEQFIRNTPGSERGAVGGALRCAATQPVAQAVGPTKGFDFKANRR